MCFFCVFALFKSNNESWFTYRNDSANAPHLSLPLSLLLLLPFCTPMDSRIAVAGRAAVCCFYGHVAAHTHHTHTQCSGGRGETCQYLLVSLAGAYIKSGKSNESMRFLCVTIRTWLELLIAYRNCQLSIHIAIHIHSRIHSRIHNRTHLQLQHYYVMWHIYSGQRAYRDSCWGPSLVGQFEFIAHSLWDSHLCFE